MNGAESDGMVVAGILTLCYRIVPTVVGEGPAGTATRNYVARDSDGARWFVKSYPAGTDLDAERQALELGEFARLGRIPVPVVRKTLEGDRIAAAAVWRCRSRRTSRTRRRRRAACPAIGGPRWARPSGTFTGPWPGTRPDLRAVYPPGKSAM